MIQDMTNMKTDVNLTNYSVLLPTGDLAFPHLNAIVGVSKISDKIRVRGNNMQKLYDAVRKGDASSTRVLRDEGTPIQYFSEERAINDVLTDRDAKNVDKPIKLQQEMVEDLTSSIDLILEKDVADLLTDASTLTNGVTLAGTTQWSHASSTPFTTLITGIKSITSNAKKAPNLGIFPVEVLQTLSQHADFIDRLKYNVGAPQQLIESLMMGNQNAIANGLAMLLNMKIIPVSAAYDNSDAGESESLTDIWGKDVVLMYQGPNTRNSYSCFKIFEYASRKIQSGRTFDPQGTKIIASRDYDVKAIRAANCGYLIQDAIA